MVSPGTLRLVAELAEDGATYEPSIDDDTAVVYPAAERVLDAAEGDPRAVLETLAERGILEREFVEKRYLCPECGTAGMRYTTACPECASAHIVPREVVECGECDTVAPPAAFETDGGDLACPDCGADPESTGEAGRDRRYVCQECGEQVESPVDALRCPDDRVLCHPTEAIERVFYRYRLGESGEEWLDSQVRARRAVAEMLADRGYDIEEDATVTGASGTDHHVHVHATDDLLDERIVADVHELPTVEDVTALRDAARDDAARPLLVTTLEAVSTPVADRATSDDVTVMTVDDEGTVSREYGVTEAPREDPSILERITTALR